MTVVTVKRPQQDYDDVAFVVMCIENWLPRALRTAANITQHELAERVGTNRLDIHRWETGYVRPALTDIDKLVRYGRELRRLAEETDIIRYPDTDRDDR